ncbi:MAG: M20/M25/M40 family metallo-hydrolase, partial [Candidatus Acidiferrales bacterium]
SNGVDWLLKNHRERVDAEYALNPDGGSFHIKDGKEMLVAIQASEKLYQDFELKVTNRGGHSSLPVPDNAIYRLAEGLTRLAQYKFPFELNEVTRAYFTAMTKMASAQMAADMNGALQTPPDPAAVARLSETPFYNGITHTTCVATRLDGGHANNALPQMARAIVNCRILPSHTVDEVRDTLIQVVADPQITITALTAAGSAAHSNPPSPLRPDLMKSLEKVSSEMWPGVPIVPVMEAGATDGVYSRAAGIPTYGISGIFNDINDDRSHGRDERVPIASFYEGVEFYYRLVKAVTSAP